MGNSGSRPQGFQSTFLHRSRGAPLNPETLQDFARRCRELMAGARTNIAREQLRVWAEEFEERAAILTRGAEASEGPQKIAAN
jgi:hypothetical protein